MTAVEVLTKIAAQEVLSKIADLLPEVFPLREALAIWSSPQKYLDGRRPCDLWSECDVDGLDKFWRYLEARADGVFS